MPPPSFPTCRIHGERMAEDRCRGCGALICITCLTLLDDRPLCPECARESLGYLRRDLDMESQIRTIGIVEAIAGAGLVVIAFLLALDSRSGSGAPTLLSGPFPWCLGSGILLGAVGLSLRALLPWARIVQMALGGFSVATPVLVLEPKFYAGSFAFAIFGAYTLWATLCERGREIFASYYREARRESRERAGANLLLLLGCLVGAVASLLWFVDPSLV